MEKEEILILCFNGSPRKEGHTAQLLKKVMEGVEAEGGKAKLIHLIDKNIKPCLGCYSSDWKNCTYPCKQKDDMHELCEEIIKADGIVLGSPSYWGNVSGIMKIFLDRMLCLENNDLIENKVGGAVAVAEETGGEEVVYYLVATLSEFGFCIPPSTACVYANHTIEEDWEQALKNAYILGRNLVRLARAIKKTKTEFLSIVDY